LLERKPASQHGTHAWATNHLYPPPDLEHPRRGAAQRWPTVSVHNRHEVETVAQDNDHALLVAHDLDAGTHRSWRVRWLVGCDGARSRVREAIGSAQEDLGLHQSWIVIDVLLKRPVDLPVTTVQFCDPARPITFVNVTGQRRRWEIMLMPGDDAQRMTEPQAVWRLLARWITPADATLVRGAVYTFHSLLARGWRERRLLIAGDAAHQTPPFLGQGMCTGIRDAANLAWKLDRVLRGAPDTLLDSYESERRPHARVFIETAVRLGNIIQTTDPAVARERDAQFAQGGTQEIVNLAPPLGPGCHTGKGAAGTLPGQPWLSDGRRMDEALGQGFALLSAAPIAPSQLDAGTLARLRAADTCWLADAALAPWLDALGTRHVLLRPDRYVFGTARDLDELAQVAATLPRLPSD
jgi:3-(3-hydroxy-phenyl)propionate hydroxylase